MSNLCNNIIYHQIVYAPLTRRICRLSRVEQGWTTLPPRIVENDWGAHQQLATESIEQRETRLRDRIR